jgi:hypothetical protein
VKWTMLHPKMTMAHLGLLPSFLSEANPARAKDQIHSAYAHGGGWNSFKGFTLNEDFVLVYPGDPPMKPLAETYLRDEHILFYKYAWVVIVQPDGTWEVARID